MAREVDIREVYRILKSHVSTYRTPSVDLIEQQTRDPFRILVSTILSARTQDKATREASQRLFKRISTSDGLKNLSVKEIERLIYPVGFYRQKARYLKQLPEALMKAGGIPQCIDELVKLPGVGRKTANLVVSVAFRKPGICVDTHVHRIMNRLGYVRTRNPLKTEMALRGRLPRRFWMGINSMLVAFGQNLCRPVSPKCGVCPIYEHCNRVGVSRSQRR